MFAQKYGKQSAFRQAWGIRLLPVLAVMGLSTAAWAEADALVATVVNGNIVLIQNGDTVELDEIDVDSPETFQFRVESFGTDPLSLSAVSASAVSGNVSLANAGFTALPNGLFAAGVNFEATAAGLVEFDVQVTSNDPDSPMTFTVTALAVAPKLSLTEGLLEVSTTAPLQIPPTELGDAGGSAVVARNIGNDILNIIGVAQITDQTGGDSTDLEVNLPAQIGPGQFAVVTVEFFPTTAGPRTFLVRINSNDPDSPYEFLVEAEGVEPEIEITDCNFNGIDDADDLTGGTSEDCNFNSVPDECETDTDGDGVIDDCEELEEITDCNFNGVDDADDLAGGTSEDCNFNDVPDECETDTDGDGVIDDCEELEEITDCNLNGTDDTEDLADGTSEDCDFNGVPDECQTDGDDDGFIDTCDNCPDKFNPEQTDSDGDGLGDACEQNDDEEKGGFCGAGALGMMPLMMFGLCGMRSRRK